VLVPGVTDDVSDLKRTREFIDSLSNVQKVEVLPYHTLGAYKWKELGMKYLLEGVPEPDEDQVKAACEILVK